MKRVLSMAYNSSDLLLMDRYFSKTIDDVDNGTSYPFLSARVPLLSIPRYLRRFVGI